MVDHHVDRPGVKAQQCVQLTGPNRSIGSLPVSRRKADGGHDPSRTAAKTASTRHATTAKTLYPHDVPSRSLLRKELTGQA